MRLSIRTNTTLLAVAILTLTLVLSIAIVERGLTARVMRDAEGRWLAHLETTGAVIAAYVSAFRTADVDGDREFLQEYVRDLGEQTSLAIRLLDDRALCVADSRGPPADGENYALRPEVRQSRSGKTGHRFTGNVRLHTRALHVAVPVMQDDKVTWTVHLSRVLSDEMELATAIRAQIWEVTKWSAGAALLLIMVGCWWLFRPLSRLTRAVTQLAESEVPGRLTVVGRDEAARLSESINKLSARVVGSSRDRAEWTDELCRRLTPPVEELRDAIRSLAEAPPVDHKRLRAQLSEVVLCSERIARLVEDVSLLERLSAGAVTPTWESLNVRDLCVAATEQVEPWAEHREVEVRVDAPPTTAAFSGDMKLLRTAAVHLLENAVRFSAPGSAIIIEAWNDNDSAGFKVLDRGAGMPAPVLSQAVEPFFAGRPAEGDFPGGAGLGLALARAIAEAHGGELELLSQADAGTAATLRLPA